MSSKMNYTPDQQKAITLSGDSLLVSAAAGSGKTAVLTERVIQKLCQNPPVPIESLMILTFTTAAAQEMKTRISRALKQRLKSEDADKALIKGQLAKLPLANISTIHSACLALVRENFEQLGLDPLFSIADEYQLALDKTEALDSFLEGLYERAQNERDIAMLIEQLVTGRDDNKLRQALDNGSAFIENEPYPELFIKTACECDFKAAALKVAKAELLQIIASYEHLETDAPPTLAEFANLEKNMLVPMLNAINEGNFDLAYKHAWEVKHKTFLRKPKEYNDAQWEGYKELRKKLKDAFLGLRNKLFYADFNVILADRESELGVIKCLLGLCAEFNTDLQNKRRAKRTVSFNDLEKYTLQLLVKSYNGKTLEKTELAKQLSQQYSEIIVDEYQDCNTTQDLIFRALSKNEKNIFTVGDVKQSIYRFRRAEPSLFLHKQRTFLQPSGDVLNAPSRVDLSKNFRSHPKVLGFINKVFNSLMVTSRGIDYADGHSLVASDLYNGDDTAAVDITLLVGSEQKLLKDSRIEAEASYVAKKIKSIIGTKTIFDAKTNTERVVEAGDIAILMRAPKTCGTLFENALKNEGIGCVNNNPSDKYLNTPEVLTLVAYLRAIDNPYNDIPLVTLMYSQYFGFDVNELGKIRANGKKMLFYDAVLEYAKTDAKTMAFVKTLEELRAKSITCSVYDLIDAVFEKSAVITRLSTEPDGQSKIANLMLLKELAAQFESGRYRGLFAFINYVIKLAERDEKLPMAKLNDSQNCVSLLSIHKSKGLEYPVVFLVNCGAQIRTGDTNDIVFDSNLGVGTKIRDTKNHREFSGVLKNIININSSHQDINEYIRLLYVALTRARSQLYITACLNASDAEKSIRVMNCITSTPTDIEVSGFASFLNWILGAVIHTKNARPFRAFAGLEMCDAEAEFDAHIVDIDSFFAKTETEQKVTIASNTIDADLACELILRKPEGEFNIPAKLSVSEIKTQNKIEQGAVTRYALPRFMQGGISGADRGSATHKFLQFCDFSKIYDSKSFDAELERLVEYEFILKSEAGLCDKERIIRFINSDIMKALNQNGECKKEERIMFTQTAGQIFGTDSSQKIVVQGVIDCWYIVNGKAVIVDYKTDRVQTDAELIDRYAIQLEMYARAIYQIYKIETAHKYIYSFALERFIEV